MHHAAPWPNALLYRFITLFLKHLLSLYRQAAWMEMGHTTLLKKGRIMKNQSALALRKSISNVHALDAFRAQLRETLTLNTTVSLFSHIIRDPGLKENLHLAVGKKGDDAIKQRVADTLTATMLGFHSANEMFAHYKGRFFDLSLFRHMTVDFETRTKYLVEQGMCLTVLDAQYNLADNFHYDATCELNEFEFLSDISSNIPWDDAQQMGRNIFTLDLPLTGAVFDLTVKDDWSCLESFYRCKEAIPDPFCAAMEYMVEMAGMGGSFETNGDPLTNSFKSENCGVIGIKQEFIDTPEEAIHALADAIISSNVTPVDMLGGKEALLTLTALACQSLDTSSQTTVSKEDATLHVDYAKGCLVFSRAGTPVFGGGLYIDDTDKRFDVYLGHVKNVKR